MSVVSPQVTHTMIGSLPIWTVTIGDQITQSRDYIDDLTAIGLGIMDPASAVKHVKIQDGSEIVFEGDIEVREARV